MGYDLQAIVAREDLLRAETQAMSKAVVTSLEQGLALVPITDAFLDQATGVPVADDLGFWRLPAGFERTLAAWSVRAPVAYLEAEFFGGVGWQRAAVWSQGALDLGPLWNEEDEQFAAEGSPISQALRRLGASAGAGQDEFTAVGLARHRHQDDCVAQAIRAASGVS
jgi:hypothetical protein